MYHLWRNNSIEKGIVLQQYYTTSLLNMENYAEEFMSSSGPDYTNVWMTTDDTDSIIKIYAGEPMKGTPNDDLHYWNAKHPPSGKSTVTPPPPSTDSKPLSYAAVTMVPGAVSLQFSSGHTGHACRMNEPNGQQSIVIVIPVVQYTSGAPMGKAAQKILDQLTAAMSGTVINGNV